MYKPYTGVGSRETPEPILKLMYTLGYALGIHGFTLRSGGADGADVYFEKGCEEACFGSRKEIFLPWKEFNQYTRRIFRLTSTTHIEPPRSAYQMASEYHPAWDRLSVGAQALHARNCQQVLGDKLDSPTMFLACWTENGEVKGGTATAIRIAKDHGIPIFNFGIDGEYEKLLSFVEPHVQGQNYE